MLPRPDAPVPPRSASLIVDTRVQRLVEGLEELKKSKVELEAKLGAANGEVRRLKAVQDDLQVEMGKLRKSREDEARRRWAAEVTAEGYLKANADQEKKHADETERSRSNLEAVKRQLEASKGELATLRADSGRTNMAVQRLTGERHALYSDLVKAEDALRETKMELEKTTRNNMAGDTLREIKGGFQKFAAALFVYCTAMAMLKVADPAKNDEVKAFARCNLGMLFATVIFSFLSYVHEWGKMVVLVCFFLLAVGALVLSYLLFQLQKDNLIGT